MADEIKPKAPTRRELQRIFGTDPRTLKAFEQLFEVIPFDIISKLEDLDASAYPLGAILFSNGSIVAYDIDNLFWDDINNRIITNDLVAKGIIAGDTASGEDLTITSTLHATKASIFFGTGANRMEFKEDDNKLLLGNITFNSEDSRADIGGPGFEAAGININGTVRKTGLRVNDFGNENPYQLIAHRHSTVNAANIIGARSNSDTSSHKAVVAGQACFDVEAAGWTETQYTKFGRMTISVDTGTISDTSAPGKISLYTTPDGSINPVENLCIQQNGDINCKENDLTNVSTITLVELSTDPSNPAEGEAVFWMGDGTGSGADGDLLYKEQSGAVVSKGNLKWTDFVPSSITVNASDGTTGTVSDVQTMFDGNVYQIEELSATPGFDVEFIFSSVDKYPTIVVTRWLYSGSATHDVTWDIWNYNSSAWDTLRSFQDSRTFEASMTMYIPRNSNGNYVSSGAAKVRVYHRSAGNAAHNIKVDYVGLTHSLQGVI
jgi:hypothetical protein